jgi:hypothetical protein
MEQRTFRGAFVVLCLGSACANGGGGSGGGAPGPTAVGPDWSGVEPATVLELDAGLDELAGGPVPLPDVPIVPPHDPDAFTPTLPTLLPGEPIVAEPSTWTWVPVPQAVCQRDDATGMYFNLGDPNKLVILMEGGGACYNSSTCTLNLAIHPVGAGPTDSAVINQVYGNNIFNRDDVDNPVRDYSFVFFPYCSGDVFAGASREGAGFEKRTQQGYYNVQAYLRRLIATFPNAEKVLLTGVSAGGFGAGFNYDQVQEAFGQKTRVYLLDDSGPPLPTEQMAPCLQERWRYVWSLDAIMPEAKLCPGCRDPYHDVGMMGLVEYLAKKYPSRRFAVLSSVHDGVIREFFGFGLDDCKNLDQTLGIPAVSPQVPPEVYEKGLNALFKYVDSIDGGATMRGFLIPDADSHTVLISPGAFKNTVVDGVALGVWLRQMIEDDPAWQHAGVH